MKKIGFRKLRILLFGSVMIMVVVAIMLSSSSQNKEIETKQHLKENNAAVTVKIAPGESASDIAKTLRESGAISSERRFKMLVSLLKYDNALTPGLYDIPIGIPTMEIVERIHIGNTGGITITIPEGLQLNEIAVRIAETGLLSQEEFVKATLHSENWKGTLAENRPQGTGLEGYLFPSTYRFSQSATSDDIVRAILLRFDEQWLVNSDRLITLNRSERTMHDVLTIASIIERETALESERSVVASVFWNRLESGIRLEADPTVQYALAQEPLNVKKNGYWKKELTLEDLAISSKFNTYKVNGLPPTPIASPGVASIDAALNPSQTTYLFFVARNDDSGAHEFAETYEQHLNNVERWLSIKEEAMTESSR